MFVYPYSPGYYFLARAQNPTRFSFLLYGYNTTEQMHEVMASLDKDQTRFVVWDTNFETVLAPAMLPAYHPPPANERIMDQYLKEHYREIAEEQGIRFMQRKSEE